MIFALLLLFFPSVNINAMEDVSDNDTAEKQTDETPYYPPTMATGTIPVVYVNTVDATPIVDKENKIPAGLYVEVPENSAYEPLGSEESPIELTIKGRGNSSWNWPKKPYKLKFEKKTSILGLPKHKHFALIAFNQGYTDWLNAMAGMELGRIAGMPWNPAIIPVELILNGSYEGLYFLVESIKIDSNRLDIFEQDELCEDPEIIPYGWLVEIDNYDDEAQISITETDNIKLRITHHSPEVVSDMQRQWLIDEFTNINAAVYSDEENDEDWTKYIDAQSLARYFIVREVLHDYDAFNGSCYLHKDKQTDAKWHFGPIWDPTVCGYKENWVIYDHPEWAQVHWMGKIFETESFKIKFNEVWDEIYPDKLNAIFPYLESQAMPLLEADAKNYERWPDISSKTTIDKLNYISDCLKSNIKWIEENKPVISGVNNITIGDSGNIIHISGDRVNLSSNCNNCMICVYELTGCKVAEATIGSGSSMDLGFLTSGIYIVTAKDNNSRFQSCKIIKP